MRKDIVRFFLKIFIAVLPVILLLSYYLTYDPFHILYKYKPEFNPAHKLWNVGNNDIIGVEAFLQNNPKYHYDSFKFV